MDENDYLVKMLQFGSGVATGPEVPDLGDLGDLGGFDADEADWENLNFDWLSKDDKGKSKLFIYCLEISSFNWRGCMKKSPF